VDVFKVEAFKLAVFILPGIITLRIKAALSISSPSKPLNTVIDGLAFTLIDHAMFGLLKIALTASAHYSAVNALNSFGGTITASLSFPGELGQAFREAGGFPNHPYRRPRRLRGRCNPIVWVGFPSIPSDSDHESHRRELCLGRSAHQSVR